MATNILTQNQTKPKIPLEQLVSSKELQEAFDVGPRTIRRWAKTYGWREHRIGQKIIRYLREDVENWTGVSFSKETIA